MAKIKTVAMHEVLIIFKSRYVNEYTCVFDLKLGKNRSLPHLTLFFGLNLKAYLL